MLEQGVIAPVDAPPLSVAKASRKLLDWTEEQVALLKNLWLNGMSASLIGARLGCSRNAVIGKVHRLDLPGRATQRRRYGSDVSGKVRRRLPKLRLQRPMTLREKSVQMCLEPAPAIPEPKVPDVGTLDLLDLEPHHCRWPCKRLPPHSSERQTFCGEKKLPGISYCQRHARRAFQAVGPIGRKGPPPEYTARWTPSGVVFVG